MGNKEYTLLLGSYNSNSDGDSVATIIKIDDKFIERARQARDLYSSCAGEGKPFDSKGEDFRLDALLFRYHSADVKVTPEYEKLYPDEDFDFDSYGEDVYIVNADTSELECWNSGNGTVEIDDIGIVFRTYDDYNNYESTMICFGTLERLQEEDFSEEVKLRMLYKDKLIKIT